MSIKVRIIPVSCLTSPYCSLVSAKPSFRKFPCNKKFNKAEPEERNKIIKTQNLLLAETIFHMDILGIGDIINSPNG